MRLERFGRKAWKKVTRNGQTLIIIRMYVVGTLVCALVPRYVFYSGIIFAFKMPTTKITYLPNLQRKICLKA